VTRTKVMHDALEQQEDLHKLVPPDGAFNIFPEDFLVGLRSALDAGLSCEQITSILMLSTALYSMGDCFDNDSLLERTSRLVSVMRGCKTRRF